jgi:hypothetical protein
MIGNGLSGFEKVLMMSMLLRKYGLRSKDLIVV